MLHYLKTNSKFAPEHVSLEGIDELPFGIRPIFKGETVSFRDTTAKGGKRDGSPEIYATLDE